MRSEALRCHLTSGSLSRRPRSRILKSLLYEGAVQGFQRPTLGPVRNFDVVSGELIQLLHTGSDHWVCISSIGCLAGHVNLYNSLYHDIINQDVEEPD